MVGRVNTGAIILLLILQLVAGDEEPFQCREQYEFDAGENPVGDLYSPFYKEKHEYTNGLSCIYLIVAPEDYRIKLTFVNLDIEPSDFCVRDAIVINNHDNDDLISSFCGTENPEPFLSDPGVNMLRLVFRTDVMFDSVRARPFRGFHIRYEASPNIELCPGASVCGNRKCYNAATQKCNGVDDCGDGTDEEGCDLPLPTPACGVPKTVPDTIFGSSDRIVGGREAIPNSWPWQVSLQHKSRSFSHTCGGTLINAQWIVTASHCFRGFQYTHDWRLHFGKHHKYKTDPFEQIRYVERAILFPNNTIVVGQKLLGKLDVRNDFALMKLNAPVMFTDVVKPACLPSQNQDLAVGTTCYATGWGETRGTRSNDVLKQVDVEVLSRDVCAFHDDTQICVKNKVGLQGTCLGDSGGPLSCKMGGKWYIMGAVSFGTDTNTMVSLCGLPGSETVFNRASAKIDWIHQMIEKYG